MTRNASFASQDSENALSDFPGSAQQLVIEVVASYSATPDRFAYTIILNVRI